jgi:hypothetical protein
VRNGGQHRTPLQPRDIIQRCNTDISLNMLGKKDRSHFHSILLHAVKFSKWLRCLPPAEMTTSCMATVVMSEEVENLPF